MNKFALILLYVLVVIFSLQYLTPSKENKKILSDNILLTIEDDTLVIPNIPKLSIINNTATGFTLFPCKDVQFRVDSQPLIGIENLSPKFCDERSISPNTTTKIDVSELAKIFASRSGKYAIAILTPLGEREISFDLSTPGALRSFLTTVVYNPIYNLFVALLTFLPNHSLGLAILIITLIIRFILLVPQHHMLQSQKKLQVIQPKIKELQKKYKDDQTKLGMEMLELYKKEGVNPMGSCLPLIIQMPILIGLYWVISGISDPANFYHLYSFFEHFDPRNINAHFFGLDLLQIGGVAAIAFGIALAIVQYIQARLSFAYQGATSEKKVEKPIEKKEGEMPEMALDPEMMKKMMLYFLPLTIGVSAYFFPLGVGLYWFIGTLFVIVQQWYVNKISDKAKSE